MIKFRAARVFSLLAIVLAVTMLIPLGATVIFAAPVVSAPTTSLVVFPFDNTTSAGGKELGTSVASAVRSWLGLSSSYSPAVFSVNNSTIQRAKQEKRVDDAELMGPFDSAKSLKLGKELGAQLVLIGSIDDYKYDSAAKDVQVTLTAQLFNVKTGEEVKTVALTGTGKGIPGATDESTLAGKAVEDAVGKAVRSIAMVDSSPTITAKAAPKKSKSIWQSKTFWLCLVGAAGAAVALTSGGSDKKSGNDLPPPPPIN